MNIRSDIKLLCATISSLTLLALVILINIALTADVRSFAFNMLFALFGNCVGWLLATFTSPYTEQESGRFGTLAKAAGAFVTGYVFGKLDDLVTHLLNPQVMFSHDNVVRSITFAVALTSSFILTYVYRSYAPNTRIPTNATDGC